MFPTGPAGDGRLETRSTTRLRSPPFGVRAGSIPAEHRYFNLMLTIIFACALADLAYVVRVLVRLGKCFVVVALVTMLGAQWTLLQTVAWTAMLADNLRTHSLSESVARTFDGKYPCPICKAIAAAKKSQKKSELTLQTQKLEFPPATENPVLFAPWISNCCRCRPVLDRISTQKPLTPPPRGLPA